MTREELLTKLAIEVDEWPIDKITPSSRYDLPLSWSWDCIHVSDEGLLIVVRKQGKALGKKHWFKRRKELINEPDDKDAPDWANWVAQDKTGLWSFYEYAPRLVSHKDDWIWPRSKKQESNRGYIPVNHNWKLSLRRVRRKNQPNDGIDPQELKRNKKNCEWVFSKNGYYQTSNDMRLINSIGKLLSEYKKGKEVVSLLKAKGLLEVLIDEVSDE